MIRPPRQGALSSFDDLLRMPADFRGEIIGGQIVEKAAASPAHGRSQYMLGGSIQAFARRPGGTAPGGWWIVTEVDVQYETHEVYRHDLTGWRREGLPALPTDRPVRVRPDWACEILSPSNWKSDTVDKVHTLQRLAVPFYWIVDLEHEVLTVYRYGNGVYEVAALAEPGQRARLQPFEAIELEVPLAPDQRNML